MEREKESVMVRRVIIFSLIFVIVFIFAGCDNPLTEVIEGDELKAQEADILAAPSKNIPGDVITGHEEIILTFEETIDTTTLSLTGDLGNKKPATAWAQTAYANDTLSILAPAGFWPAGSGKTLTISCTGTSGKILSAYSFTFDVFHGTCVDDGGSPTNNGSATKPYDTIQAGIDQADTLYVTAEVRVAEGNYTSNYNASGNPVAVMANGISLYGGYPDESWTNRSPDTFFSNITDTSTTGGTEATPNRAVYFGSGITDATVFDGFYVTTGDGDKNAGIFCDNSSPRIEHNTIRGRDQGEVLAGDSYYAISNFEASPIIRGNTIEAKWNNTSYSYGIFNSASSGTIDSNWIHGGYGYFTIGIYNLGASQPDIYNNIILGGGDSNTHESFGIKNLGSSPNIYNNTIDGGRGDDPRAYCIRLQTGSPKIHNNILFYSSVNLSGYGIYEHSVDADPASVRYNNFYNFNSGGSLYYDEASIDVDDLVTAVSTGEGSQTLSSWGNVSEDPGFTGDYHLSDGGSGNINIRYGGENLSAGFTLDKDGTTRTTGSSGQTNGGDGWSMGAYEY